MEDTTGAAEPVVEPTMAQVAAAGEPAEPATSPEPTPEPVAAEPTPGDSPPPGPIAEEAPAQDAVDKRIGKITAEKYGFKREAEGLRAELEQLKAKQGQPPLPKDAPKLEDYDYDDAAHQAAVIQYHVDKTLERKSQESNIAQQAQDRQKISDDYNVKEAKYIEEHPKYVEAVGNLPKFPKDTLNLIYEMGPQVTHYLADNPDKAYEVAGANLTQAAVKLGQISMGLTADSKPVKTTTAPEPVKTIAGGAAVTKSMEDWSMDEIMAYEG